MNAYVVRCEDGQIRHTPHFDTRADAEHFAEWGHACTRHHEIVDVGAALASFDASMVDARASLRSTQ